MNKYMTYMICRLALCVFFLAIIQKSAYAQTCQTNYETIIRMKDPKIGSYSIWDSIRGDSDHHERFVSGVPRPNWKTVVLGEQTAVDQDTPTKVILEQLDHRGRADWEHIYDVPGLINVLKIQTYKDDHYLMLGNIKRPKERTRVWIGVADKNGQLKDQKIIGDRKGHLTAFDLIPINKTKLDQKGGFKLLTNFIGPSDDQYTHTRLYSLTENLNVLKHRAYVTGSENTLQRVYMTDSNHLIGAGYVYGTDGRKNGWVVKFDQKDRIDWQRQYPRGKSAQLNTLHPVGQNYLLLAGQSQPVGKGTRAAWIMMIEKAGGEIMWQQYYTDVLDNDARDILVNNDTLISVLVAGTKPLKSQKATKQSDFVRLLTLNAQGMLLGMDEYFNGEGSTAFDLLNGPKNERIIVGQTRTVEYPEGNQGEDAQDDEASVPLPVKRSMDGWVVVGAKAQQYVDPCRKIQGIQIQ